MSIEKNKWHQVGFSLLNYKDDARSHKHKKNSYFVHQFVGCSGLCFSSKILLPALRHCTGRTARRGCRGIALLFLDHGTRRRWGVSVTPRPLFTPRKDTVPIEQEAGWTLGPVWTGAENLTFTGIRSPDRRARSYPARSGPCLTA